MKMDFDVPRIHNICNSQNPSSSIPKLDFVSFK